MGVAHGFCRFRAACIKGFVWLLNGLYVSSVQSCRGALVKTRGFIANHVSAVCLDRLLGMGLLGFGVPYFNTFFLEGTLMK